MAEWEAQLEQLPGKLTKFVFAVGMLVRVGLARRVDQACGMVRSKFAAVRRMWTWAADLSVFEVLTLLVIAAAAGMVTITSFVLAGVNPVELMRVLAPLLSVIGVARILRKNSVRVLTSIRSARGRALAESAHGSRRPPLR